MLSGLGVEKELVSRVCIGMSDWALRTEPDREGFVTCCWTADDVSGVPTSSGR